MRNVAAERRLTHWAQIVQDRVESGLNVRTFCKNAGIHENVYFYWQRKLREKACEVSGITTKETRLVPQGFAEVKIKSQTTMGSHIASKPQQLRIEYADLLIIADSGYPTDDLAYLLKELVQI